MKAPFVKTIQSATLFLLLLTAPYGKAQTLDKIRQTYFYSLPFNDSISFQELVATIDKKKDSFYLIYQSRSGYYIDRSYVSLFTDSHFTTKMCIDVSGMCKDINDTACHVYFLRLITGSVVPNARDSSRLDFRLGNQLTHKDRKRIFRKINRSVFLRKKRVKYGWGRELIGYKEKTLTLGKIHFKTFYNGGLHILLFNR